MKNNPINNLVAIVCITIGATMISVMFGSTQWVFAAIVILSYGIASWEN